MYKWPDSIAETTEQLRRFSSLDDVSLLRGNAKIHRDLWEVGDFEDAEVRGGEEDFLWGKGTPKNKFSSKMEEDNDESAEIQTYYSFDTLRRSARTTTENPDRGVEHGVAGRIGEDPYRFRHRQLSPWPIYQTSREICAPASFFISSSSATALLFDDRAMNTSISAPCMHSSFYDDEEPNSTVLRRAKSDVEEVTSSAISPASITDPIMKEPKKKKKAFALALHLKRQREREKQKRVGDRMATELWGSATTLEKVKKEYKSLKGIP